jgi:hypothetical protein
VVVEREGPATVEADDLEDPVASAASLMIPSRMASMAGTLA